MIKTVNKNLVKECYYIRIVLTMLLAVLFLSQFTSPFHAQAATKEYGRFYRDGSNTQIQSGKYYYTFQSDGLYVSESAGLTGTQVLPKMKKTSELSDTVYLSKKYLYYVYYDRKSFTVYRMKPDGTEEKKIAGKKLKFSEGEGISIQFVYSDQYIVLERNILGDARTYSVNVKTGKINSVAVDGKKKHYSLDFEPDSYQSYYVATGSYMSVTDIWPVYVYNVKSKSIRKLEENARGIAIGGKYIYYIEYHRGKSSAKLIRCNLNGKNKKTICTIKTKYKTEEDALAYGGPFLCEATSRYCIYMLYSLKGKDYYYYKYTFSTKKNRKIKYNPVS